MTRYRVPNWEKYQHYSKRNPPWIKLHVRILNDSKFCALAQASRGLLVQAWVLAAEGQGEFDGSLEELRFRLRDPRLRAKDLQVLVDEGLIVPCKQTLAPASGCSSETEAETEERQRQSAPLVGFDSAYSEYPHYQQRTGKAKSKKVWQDRKLEPLTENVLAHIKVGKRSDDWTRDNGKYVPAMEVWLRKMDFSSPPEEPTKKKPFVNRLLTEEEKRARRTEDC